MAFPTQRINSSVVGELWGGRTADLIQKSFIHIGMDSEVLSTTYVVQDGDTLLGLSIKLGVSVGALKRLNRMFGGSKLYPGQILNIKPSDEFPMRYDGREKGSAVAQFSATSLPSVDVMSSPAAIRDEWDALTPLTDEDDSLVVVDSSQMSSPDVKLCDFEFDAEIVDKPHLEPVDPPTVVLASLMGNILSMEDMNYLLLKVPAVLQNDKWLLVYSVLENGADFTTFYNNAAGHKYTIVAVETTSGDKFGGFATSAWRKAFTFYGGGDSFVYRIGPGGEVNIYPCTGENDYVMYSDDENIAMGGGGGEGGFAFALDVDFFSGQSSASSCFGSPPLVSASGSFRVTNVEVWGFESFIPKASCSKSRSKKT